LTTHGHGGIVRSMADEARVLVVDDDPDLVRLLRYALSKDGYQVATATSGGMGLQQAAEFRPQVVITDLMMPGLDGTALCRELKADPGLHPIYVIILTAKDEPGCQVNSLDLGADDYVVKPAGLQELRARVEVGLRWVRSQTQLQQMATSDKLTGLPNRYVMDGVLAREVSLALKENKPLSVIWLDLDHFKGVNDTYGHAVGDRALQQLAEIIRAQVRGTDIPARYGGEEFVIVLPGVDSATAWGIARRLRQVIAGNLWPSVIKATADMHVVPPLEGTSELTASLGVASLDQLSEPTAEAVLRAADAAAYAAKEAGRNRVRMYQSEDQDEREPQRQQDGAAAGRDVEESRLYEAMALLGPAASFRDPGMTTQMMMALSAQAAGWVWCDEANEVQSGGCVGVSSEVALQLARRLYCAEGSKVAGPRSNALPVEVLSGLGTASGDTGLATAAAAAALDDEGQVRGGVWAAWKTDLRLTSRHKFILTYVARVLGLELELQAARRSPPASLTSQAEVAAPRDVS
jgi:two-component system cell cycle response regulator